MNSPTRVVLVGGGHSHVQVLEELARRPLEGARVVLIVDRARALYSGMVPGLIADMYDAEDLTIRLPPLARRAGAEVVLEPMSGIDPRSRRIGLESGGEVDYDVASLNLGSTVAGLHLPGVKDHAVPTRPIARLVEEVEDVVERARSRDRATRLVIVGGGAGGVELAFCFEARLRRETGRPPRVSLVTDEDRILPGMANRVSRRTATRAADRGIEILTGRRVTAVGDEEVELDAGDPRTHDVVLWVAGAAGRPELRSGELPVDSRGFVRIGEELLVEGFDSLFAVGDCATPIAHPRTPKAGVYAVRQGPVLAENLRRWCRGESLERYRPQRDFLTLLNLGDGTALGTKWGFVAVGRWVMLLKDRIDRRFVDRFRVS